MDDYKVTPDSINALLQIARLKERPLMLVNQLTQERMREVALMIDHDYLEGTVNQRPPSYPIFNMTVFSIKEKGTAVLVEHFPNFKKEVDAMIDSELSRAVANGRPGDPIYELAKQKLKAMDETENAKREAEKESDRLLAIAHHEGEMQQASKANQIAEKAFSESRKANRLSCWSMLGTIAGAMIAGGALIISLRPSQDELLKSEVVALKNELRVASNDSIKANVELSKLKARVEAAEQHAAAQDKRTNVVNYPPVTLPPATKISP